MYLDLSLVAVQGIPVITSHKGHQHDSHDYDNDHRVYHVEPIDIVIVRTIEDVHVVPPRGPVKIWCFLQWEKVRRQRG